MTLFGLIAACAFAAGFGASELIMAKRIAVSDPHGKIRINMSADAASGGLLEVLDHRVDPVFSVRNGQVAIRGAENDFLSNSATTASIADNMMMMLEVEQRSIDSEAIDRASDRRDQADRIDKDIRAKRDSAK